MKFIRKLTKNSNYTIQVRTNTPSADLSIPIYYVICVSYYIIILTITKILEMSNKLRFTFFFGKVLGITTLVKSNGVFPETSNR